jgi:CPA2 family monovalent cation:H+ antiporter-2
LLDRWYWWATGGSGAVLRGRWPNTAFPYVIAEQNRELVEALRKQGVAAVSGNAAEPAVLIQAHIANAAMLVIATQHPIDIRQMADTARKLNPGIEIVVRTHNEDESELLRKDGIGTVFLGVEELSRGMIQHIVQRFTPPTTSERRQAGDSGQA